MVGYVTAQLVAHILEKCGDDLTHDNVLKQATTLQNPPLGMLAEGVTINNSPDNYLPFGTALRVGRPSDQAERKVTGPGCR